MITYELMLLLKVMPKPELVSTLKRVSNVIYEKGGVIRKLENLGTRDMPYKISAHGVVFRQASYFLYEFNVPPISLESINDEYNRDVDIVRQRVFRKKIPDEFECTLHEELLPPPYRKSVQEMIKEARKYDKPRFEYNSGLDYYPFQK